MHTSRSGTNHRRADHRKLITASWSRLIRLIIGKLRSETEWSVHSVAHRVRLIERPPKLSPWTSAPKHGLKLSNWLISPRDSSTWSVSCGRTIWSNFSPIAFRVNAVGNACKWVSSDEMLRHAVSFRHDLGTAKESADFFICHIGNFSMEILKRRECSRREHRAHGTLQYTNWYGYAVGRKFSSRNNSRNPGD